MGYKQSPRCPDPVEEEFLNDPFCGHKDDRPLHADLFFGNQAIDSSGAAADSNRRRTGRKPRHDLRPRSLHVPWSLYRVLEPFPELDRGADQVAPWIASRVRIVTQVESRITWR